MNKKFLKQRLLRLGLIVSTYCFGQTFLLSQQEESDTDKSYKNLWQVSDGKMGPFSSKDLFGRKNSNQDPSLDWKVNISNDNKGPVEIRQTSTELGFGSTFFSIEENSQHHTSLDELLNTPHMGSLESREDGKEWQTEIEDPNLVLYPGVLSNHFFDTEDQLNSPAFEEDLSIYTDVIKKAESSQNENKEVAQAAPPINPTPPSPVITPTPPLDTNPPIITNPTDAFDATTVAKPVEAPSKTILINFNNVSIIEFIRFVSRISNKNFVFDENDLQFNVTIISEEPTSIENIMTALLQELRIHDLLLLEEGNNLVIHKNPRVNNISKVVMENQTPSNNNKTEIITQVYRLNTLDPERAAGVIKPLASDRSIIEVLKNPNNLIVTDLAVNIIEITQLIKDLDSPKSGLVIGQYVVRNAFMDTLIQLAQKIMEPIAKEQTLTFVPHVGANSIFVISTPYLVERTISILQYLDQFQGSTRILNAQDLNFQGPGSEAESSADGTGGRLSRANAGAAASAGRWERDAQGNWQYTPTLPPGAGVNPNAPPDGRWLVDENGNWYFQAGAPGAGTAGLQGPGGEPEGQWVLSPGGIWVFQLTPGRSISAERLSRNAKAAQELPSGHIERTQFFIYKLKYRKGDQIEKTLGRVAKSFEKNATNNTNSDLVAIINSIQWIESVNSLVFSGTPAAIEKMKDLVQEVDIPLRQVFIEMLILTASLQDSMELGVDFGSRFGGGQGGGLVAGSQAFLNNASTLPTGLDTAGLVGTSSAGVAPTAGGENPVSIADASSLARISGRYSLGLIGQSLHFGGTTFNSIGALINALHTKTKVDILMNPKILAEDGSTAEIFVGENTQYPTQAVANDRGSIVTQNFTYQDIGTRLKVQPVISSNDVITLNIEEEVSSVAQQATTVGNTNQVIGPTTNVSKSTMRVHLPNKYFMVISGLVQNQDTRTRDNVPCLGGVPLLGGAFSDTTDQILKQNTMIFIRPEIIDTEAQINDITKRQQDIFKIKAVKKKDWIYEDQEALDWMNLKNTDWNSDDSSLE